MGYIKCEKNHKQKLEGFVLGQARKNLSLEQMAKIGKYIAQNND